MAYRTLCTLRVLNAKLCPALFKTELSSQMSAARHLSQRNTYINFVASVKSYCTKTQGKLDPAAKPPSVTPLSSMFPKPIDLAASPDQNPNSSGNDGDSQKAREQSWRTMKYTLAAFGFSFAAFGTWLFVEYGAPERDETGAPIPDEFSSYSLIPQYFLRMLKQLDYFQKMIKEPSRDKLLPDVPGPPYFHPPYTLVLELTDVLVHPDWTYQTGWRFKKRPGIDHFLQQLGPPLFEIVIFTAETGMTVFPIIEALDPNNIISFKLVRDATHFMDGHHVKNLDKLNRDLSKVIVVDWNAESVKFHPENTLKLPRWHGNDDDTTLIDLTAFLKTIASSRIEDVREVLRYYGQFDNPLAVFRENQRRLMEQQEAQRELEASQPPQLTKTWSQTFLRH